MEGAGFEPAKSSTADLQSAPFSHSGTPPYLDVGGEGLEVRFLLEFDYSNSFYSHFLFLTSYFSLLISQLEPAMGLEPATC